MWFYVPAIILVILFTLWFRRTHVYRHLRSGHGVPPGQGGYAASAPRWEGGAGDPGAGGGGAPGGDGGGGGPG